MDHVWGGGVRFDCLVGRVLLGFFGVLFFGSLFFFFVNRGNTL